MGRFRVTDGIHVCVVAYWTDRKVSLDGYFKARVEQDQDFANEFRALLDFSLGSYNPPTRGKFEARRFYKSTNAKLSLTWEPNRDGIVPIQDLERLDPKVRGDLRVGAEIPAIRN